MSTVRTTKNRQSRTPHDPSKDVFGMLDNILDHETDLDDLLEQFSDSDEAQIEPNTPPLQREEQPTKEVIELIPYFNTTEDKVFIEMLKSDSSIDYDIQQCFKYIVKLLVAYDSDPASINSGMIETKCLALLDNISIATEPFWSEMSFSKDIISYKLQQRLFPTFTLVDKETKTTIDPKQIRNPVKPKPVKKGDTQDNTQNTETTETTIRKKYDLGKPSLQATLNHQYIDEGVTVTESGVRQYQVLPPEKYSSIVSQDKVDYIFKICKIYKFYKVMLSLFCRLCASREFCHLVFNSQFIINTMFEDTPDNPFASNEYQEIIHYFMFYGFYLMYKEECTIKAMANPSHRCVLDLENVQRLPIYDGPLSSNPYIPLTLGSKYLYANNVETADYLFKPIRMSNADRGLYTLHSVQARVDVFTDGVFRGLTWDKLSMTGSVLPACVIRNPLEKLFGIHLSRDTDLNNPEAAVAYWQNPEMRKNLENYFDEYYPSKNILDPRYITPGSPLYDQLPKATEMLSDIDIIADITDDEEFDKKVYEVYELVQANVRENHQRDPAKYPSDQVNIIRITTDQSYKYYISGPGLHKNIELFRIFVHPLGCVSRFHFPCVRGIYTGNAVKLFPSMLSAAYTGVLLEYKWMSSAKNTKDLVCKYYTRGFHLILNDNEHAAMKTHISANQHIWGYLMAAANNARSISLINPVFKPRQNRAGLYANFSELILKQSPIYQFAPAMANFDEYWQPQDKTSRHGFSLALRHKAGNIRVPELWKIGAYTHDLGLSAKYK